MTPTYRAALLVAAMRRVEMRAAGDLPGHEFQGNQYTGNLASYTVDPSVPAAQREKLLKAVKFVEQSKTDYLSKVHLFVSPTGKGHTVNPYGYTKRNIKIENGKPVRDEKGNLVYTGKYSVYISSRQSSTEGFVRTIAHEIEHVAQWERGEELHEAGAMAVGHQVSRKFRGASAKEGPLHAAADKFVPAFSVALRAAFALGRKALGGSTQHRVDAAVAAIKRALQPTLPGLIKKALAAGGKVTAASLTPRTAELRTAKDPQQPNVKFAFDATNHAAVDWADRHAAELIDGIAETSREAINNAIADALESGDLEDALDEILAAVGDADRAELIARNETFRAVAEGQRQAWDQAVGDGLLTGDEKRTWIVVGDDKVCPICDGLDGQTVGLDESYQGDGEEYDGPPAHVNCRCTEGISGLSAAAFNPDEARDEKGQWTSGDAVHYHGTTSAAVDRIVKEGIQPAAKVGGKSSQHEDLAYATEDFDNAKTYAVYKARETNTVPAIFELHIPPADVAALVATYGKGWGFIVSEGFKPEWIKAVHTPDAAGKMQRRELAAKGDISIVYAVVLLPKEISS